MAKPQLEEGFTPYANEIEEAFAKINLSPYESRVVRAVARKTYGWHKKFDRISFSQLQELTSLKRQHASRTMASLISRNIITRRGEGHKLQYGIQKDYEQWKDAQTSSPEVTSEAEKTSEEAQSSPVEVTDTHEEAQTSPAEVKTSPSEDTKTSPSEGHTKPKKETIQKQDIINVFTFWNKAKVIVHDNMTPTMETCIRGAIKQFGAPKVILAIGNYGQLVNGDYDWTYKWTLQDFLGRGKGNNIERFKNMEVLNQNHGKKTGRDDKYRGNFEEGRSNTYSKPPTFKE